MDTEILEIMKELDVVVITGPLENPGYYIPKLNAIFIDQSLNDEEHRVVLLHELGHAAKQRNEYILYQATMTMKSKMEYGANRFMIKYLFDHYILITGDDPHSVNYIEFMRQNDIPACDENIVKDIILNY